MEKARRREAAVLPRLAVALRLASLLAAGGGSAIGDALGGFRPAVLFRGRRILLRFQLETDRHFRVSRRTGGREGDFLQCTLHASKDRSSLRHLRARLVNRSDSA